MATYEYEILDQQGKPTGERFEVQQAMRQDAWDRVPSDTQEMLKSTQGGFAMNLAHFGKPCRRVISVPRFKIGTRSRKAESTGQTPDHLLRPMTKRESLTHWYPPSMVEHVRREIGGQAANCIQDDGRVLYEKPGDDRRFCNAANRMEKRKAQRKQDRESALDSSPLMSGSAKVKKIPAAMAKRRKEFA